MRCDTDNFSLNEDCEFCSIITQIESAFEGDLLNTNN